MPAPLNELGQWQTNYEDAGEYDLEISATDGTETVREEITITILDVDRAPEIEIPDKLYVNEGEEGLWKFSSTDPDGDEVNLRVNGTLLGAEFNENTNTLTFNPTFEFIQRKNNLFNNYLQLLGIERYLLRERAVPLTIESCGKELCTTKIISLVVANINRPPKLVSVPAKINVSATEKIVAQVVAIDPDDDVLTYRFTWPLGKKNGEWQTDYEDFGDYNAAVTISDGLLSDSAEMRISVAKKNRAPTLKIKNDDLVVNEGQQFMFEVRATDADNDPLTINLENLPPGASFQDGIFLWSAPFTSVLNKTDTWKNNLVSRSAFFNKKFNTESAIVWLNFMVSDGEEVVSHPVKVTIKNVNHKPEILDYLPTAELEAKVGQPVLFHVAAKDADNDRLTYTWSFGWNQEKVSGTDTVQRTFMSPSEKKVRVVISDGRDALAKEWVVKVTGQAAVPTIVTPTVAQDPFTIKVYVVERKRTNYN